VVSSAGSLPGFCADGTLCSSRCAITVGRVAAAVEIAGPAASGDCHRGPMTPLAAPANPGTNAKAVVTATIRIKLVDLALT
jgi:hypothetical protein